MKSGEKSRVMFVVRAFLFAAADRKNHGHVWLPKDELVATTLSLVSIQGGTAMERKTRKTRERREFEMFLNELALRSIIIMLLGFLTVLLATRPPWAVNTVRLLVDAVKGAGTYF